MRKASVEKVAADILGAIYKEKKRSGGGFFKVMNAIAPGLLDRMFTGMALGLGRQAGMWGVGASAPRGHDGDGG